jgi:hypothetical protein
VTVPRLCTIPVTGVPIGPILGRIFSSILDGRIRRGIAHNLRQQGFTSESGCKINIDLLNAAINYSKRNRGGGCFHNCGHLQSL